MSKLDALLHESRRASRARDTSGWDAKIRRILDACHPAQRAFVEDPSKRVAALVGGRGGKTTGGRARLLIGAMRIPRAKQLYIATTKTHAEELMWAPLKELVGALDLEARFNETKLTCTLLRNKSEIKLVGADDKREIDKLRGIPRDGVGVDECAAFPVKLFEQLIERAIEPRLGDRNGVLWLIGTPGHILSGLFYDATRDGSPDHRPYADRDLPEYADWDGWSSHAWALPDGAPYVPAIANAWANALRTKKRKGWSDDHPVWKREYLGKWAADDTENIFKYRAFLDDGTPWNQWDPERDARTGVAKLPPGDWRYTYGFDLGSSDPMTLEVLAYDPSARDRTLWQIYEFERKGMYARTIAELLIGEDLDAANPKGIIGVTGWPDAMVADLAHLGGAILDELANVYGIKIAAAEKKHKHDAFELTNGDLLDGRFKVLKGSQLEQQMLDLQWEVDEYGILKEPKGKPNHATDAAIYARRAALHQYADDETPEAPPVPGSPEALAAAERAFDDPQQNDELDEHLAPSTYDDDDWLYG